MSSFANTHITHILHLWARLQELKDFLASQEFTDGERIQIETEIDETIEALRRALEGEVEQSTIPNTTLERPTPT